VAVVRRNLPPGRAAPARPRTADAAVYALGAAAFLAIEAYVRARYAPDPHLRGLRLLEYHGHAALVALALALAARPLARVWTVPLRARRALGVLAFAFSAVHGWYALEHVLDFSLETLEFLTPSRLASLWVGVVSLALMLPLAITSNDASVRRLGRRWVWLHRLAPPAALLAVLHTAWMGAHYGLQPLAPASILALLLTAALFAWRARRPAPRGRS
jgi:DMSO/TMAO reductase YedYZ heme-binding membrane subunit